MAGRRGVLGVDDDALGGVGGREGIKNEGIEATLDFFCFSVRRIPFFLVLGV